MEERIQTLHPQGKQGVNILKSKYDQIVDEMVSIIKNHGEITYQDLNDEIIDALEGKFDGKIPWYVVTVKLDLEARKIIERVPKTSPHKVRLL